MSAEIKYADPRDEKATRARRIELSAYERARRAQNRDRVRQLARALYRRNPHAHQASVARYRASEKGISVQEARKARWREDTRLAQAGDPAAMTRVYQRRLRAWLCANPGKAESDYDNRPLANRRTPIP